MEAIVMIHQSYSGQSYQIQTRIGVVDTKIFGLYAKEFREIKIYQFGKPHLKSFSPSSGDAFAVGISASFDITVSIPVFDGVLPAIFTAMHWYMSEFCSFLTERRTKYEMLPFWIRVGFKRSALFLSQVISGRGEPVVPHSKMASRPSSTTRSPGWTEKPGFQITVDKNNN